MKINCFNQQNVSSQSNSSLPVMVYIHEGGFFSGMISRQMRGPQYFMDTSEVIMVLIAYRLGVLGKYFKHNSINVFVMIYVLIIQL